MRHNLIKPYSHTDLTWEERITNYRISRARRIIENTFGILAARFRIYRRPIIAKVETIESITKATVVLHNYLMKNRFEEYNSYCPNGFVDSNQICGEWRRETQTDSGFLPLSRLGTNNYTRDAKKIRDTFSEYFNSTSGSVPWQNDMVSV